jgi:hypothetical protein
MDMTRLIKAEIYRMSRTLTFPAFLISMAAAYLLIARFNLRIGNLMPLHVLYVIVSNPLPMMWIGVAAASFFVGEGLGERTLNGAIYSGKSRHSILFSKAVCYYLTAAAVQIISLLLAIIIDGRILGNISADIIVGRIAVSVLAGLGTVSFPLIFVFIFQDAYKSIAGAGIFTYLMQQLMSNAAAGSAIEKVLRFYPPFLQADYGLRSMESMDDVYWIIVVSMLR